MEEVIKYLEFLKEIGEITSYYILSEGEISIFGNNGKKTFRNKREFISYCDELSSFKDKIYYVATFGSTYHNTGEQLDIANRYYVPVSYYDAKQLYKTHLGSVILKIDKMDSGFLSYLKKYGY